MAMLNYSPRQKSSAIQRSIAIAGIAIIWISRFSFAQTNLDHSSENLNGISVNAAVQPTLLSVKQYLAEEETSAVRHEYVRGYVYAMAGASKAHNEICLNIAEILRAHLRGGPCRTSMAEVKLRPHFDDELFYYPDLMVTCDPRDEHPLFNRFPKLIVEVTSESTEMLDRREKLLEYLRVETLEEYVLIAQDRIEATVFRRSNDWKPQIIRDSNGELSLESLNLTAKLSAIYAGVVF